MGTGKCSRLNADERVRDELMSDAVDAAWQALPDIVRNCSTGNAKRTVVAQVPPPRGAAPWHAGVAMAQPRSADAGSKTELNL